MSKEISTVEDYLNVYREADDFIGYKDCPYDYFKEHKLYSDWSHQAFGQTKGIYFLLKDDEIVYVGMSSYSIAQRIQSHLKDKDFDNVKYLCARKYSLDLSMVEYVYINIFNPKYNIVNKHFLYSDK